MKSLKKKESMILTLLGCCWGVVGTERISKMMQLALDGFDADQVDLLARLSDWPQSFTTIRYQTGWGFERASRAVEGLLVAGKVVKLCDGAFRPLNPNSI